MADSNLDHLDRGLEVLCKQCLQDWSATYPDRHPVEVRVTWRSPADQQKAYDAGLSHAKPGQSKHECHLPDGTPASRAFDYAVFDETGNYIADGTDDWYADFAKIAKNKGLVWGGDWGHPDWDHIELPD